LDTRIAHAANALQNEEYYGKLQPLVAALGKEVPDAKYDAKSLVVMLVQILHFQEAALGRDVSVFYQNRGAHSNAAGLPGRAAVACSPLLLLLMLCCLFSSTILITLSV
jgi:hypothetical protein